MVRFCYSLIFIYLHLLFILFSINFMSIFLRFTKVICSSCDYYPLRYFFFSLFSSLSLKNFKYHPLQINTKDLFMTIVNIPNICVQTPIRNQHKLYNSQLGTYLQKRVFEIHFYSCREDQLRNLLHREFIW